MPVLNEIYGVSEEREYTDEELLSGSIPFLSASNVYYIYIYILVIVRKKKQSILQFITKRTQCC